MLSFSLLDGSEAAAPVDAMLLISIIVELKELELNKCKSFGGGGGTKTARKRELKNEETTREKEKAQSCELN